MDGQKHGRMDDGQKVINIAHPEHSSGELMRNLLNGYAATAGGVQEMELNAQTKYCSAKSESRSRSVMVDSSWQGASWQSCV